ncbi:MAG: TPM domain-containing protein, partial [Flavobacterium sp.]|nr:TPM domain-containing protein [Flavobacterium sp.]
MKNILLVVFFGLFFAGSSLAQYEIPDVPKKQTSVYDYSKVLSLS